MLKILTAAEQAARHLRLQIAQGTYRDLMPGCDRLERDLGVGRNTVNAALALLEEEGLLIPQGNGRRRRIRNELKSAPPSLRVRVLPYDRGDLHGRFLGTLWNRLQLAGHRVEVADKTLEELKMDPRRVARMVSQTDARAWIVLGGSLKVLQGFTEQECPTFCVSGRHNSLPLAGSSAGKEEAMQQCVKRLTDLGHRRIVLLCREDRRKPKLGQSERAFIEALEQAGIATSGYHLPDWGNTKEEFQQALDQLFRLTPPTALILSGGYLYLAAERHLAQRGIVAPRDISLVSTDYYPEAFFWSQPEISHFWVDWDPVARRIVRWAEKVATGARDLRKTSYKATFIEGGTIGPTN